jgi:hypothetical protein
MAFVVEDGTGKADANALTDLTFADDYFGDRGVAAWAALTTQRKQQCLVMATDYIETRWSAKFKGDRQFTEDPAQALSFPRTDIGSDGAVPVGIQKATAEYALRASVAPLAPDPVVDSTGRSATKIRSKVGPLEDEAEYATEGPLARPALLRPYPAADLLVRPFVRSSSGVIR